jgi:hypothetical protein
MQAQQKQKLITILGIALVVLLVLVLFVIPFFQHQGKVALTVTVLPKDSTFLVDNKKTRAGKVYVAPGKHTLKATRPDFADVSKSIDTAKINTKDTIYLMPKPNSENAFTYLETHPEVQQQREAAESVEVQRQQQQLSKYPIISQLPYTAAGFEYVINYDAETDSNGDIKVTFNVKITSDDAKAEALQWFKDHGTDPSKLNITFEGVQLPDDPNIGHQ